jgi:hypothetical protein
MSFFDFCDSLCASLIWNSHLDGDGGRTRKRGRDGADVEDVTVLVV